MQVHGPSDRLPRARDAIVAAGLLAALASCAAPAVAPVKGYPFAQAVVQTDFLLIANDRGVSCNFTVRELAAGSDYTRELQGLSVTIGTGPRVGAGQIGVILGLTRADSSSVTDPWSLVWPVVINNVHLGSASYAEPDRWPGQQGYEAARRNIWTLPRSHEVVRSIIESLDAGQVAISYTTLGSSFYAKLGPTYQHGGSKPQAFDWTVPVMANATDRAHFEELRSCANRLGIDSILSSPPTGHT